jgi:rhomboid protease GluP
MSPFALLLIAAVAVYFMTPEERRRALAKFFDLLSKTVHAVATLRRKADDPFFAQIRDRVRWPLVTYVLVAANVAMLAAMLQGTGALGDPLTLVEWGGNFGPRTTGGERWRVFTSIFVHRGALHLLVNIVALIQLGLILERVVGPFTFGILYFAAGALGSIMSAAASPMEVFVGATGAVSGLYGLLLVAAFRGTVQGTAPRIPLKVLGVLVPAAAVFALYCVAAGEPPVTIKAGLFTGVVGGFALTRSVREYRARLSRFAVLGTATAIIVLMSANALRAVTDVRPGIIAVVATEERTARVYDEVVLRFRNGRMTARELSQVIDQSIMPDLQRTRDAVNALVDVPPADAYLVNDAQDYLRRRQESWRVRADALRTGRMRNLREAARLEQISLQVFEKLKAAVPHP